jgi:hypothetical protein
MICWGGEMKKFVQPDPSIGYRFTSYRLEGEGPYPFVQTGYIYHKIDLSDLDEPYLSAVKKSLAEDLTPKPQVA